MAAHDALKLSGYYVTQQIRVIEPVAQGGFGLVYRAHHEALGVQVALKVFALLRSAGEHIRAEAERLFIQEARLVAKLQHPAIVKPYDAGFLEIEGYGHVPWLALEWLHGSTLSAIQQGRGFAPWRRAEVLALLRPVCEALAEAHEQGIAHRDVSPNNLFVCAEGSAQRVRLIDFGIAKVVHDPAWATLHDASMPSGLVAFAPKFPSPEQVLGATTGPRTDVHALALLASHLLTGHFPFSADLWDANEGACTPLRPTPARFGVDVGAWEHVIARALSLDPDARYANARAFLTALLQAEETEQRREKWERESNRSPLLLSFSDAGSVVQHNVGAVALQVCTLDLSRAGVRSSRDASIGAMSLRFSAHQDQLVVSSNGRASLYGDPHDRATKGSVYLTPGSEAQSVYLRHPHEAEPIELRCHAQRAERPGEEIEVDALGARFEVPHGARVAVVYRRLGEGDEGRNVECFYVKW
jgi:serine/threonine protein kinase